VPIRVSDANHSLTLPPLGKEEVIRWTSFDGQNIEGLLVYPLNYEPGKKYPLVAILHGGPTDVATQTFIGTAGHPIAELSERGYAVILPNFRGPRGYGLQFRLGLYKNWGDADYKDVETGIDHLISMGIADSKRLGFIGWSYGRYLTA